MFEGGKKEKSFGGEAEEQRKREMFESVLEKMKGQLEATSPAVKTYLEFAKIGLRRDQDLPLETRGEDLNDLRKALMTHPDIKLYETIGLVTRGEGGSRGMHLENWW